MREKSAVSMAERRFRVVAVGRMGRPEVQTGMVVWSVAIDKLRELGPEFRIAEVEARDCACGAGRVLVGLICVGCSKVAPPRRRRG